MVVPANQSILAVDTQPAPADVAAEATRVRMAGTYITAIGKELGEYDALDTGVFVCSPALFGALDGSPVGRHDAERRDSNPRGAAADAGCRCRPALHGTTSTHSRISRRLKIA